MKRSSVLAAAVFFAIGCAELPPEHPGVQSVPQPQQPENRGPIRTDPLISNSLIDLLENKDKLTVSLGAAQGTPLGEILTVGSPIGYALRNRHLNLGIPIAEALSRNSDPVFREKLVTEARWDRNDEVRAAALVALARTQDVAYLNTINEALVHLNPAVRFAALEALLVWGHPEKALPLLSAASEKDNEPILRVYAAGGLARLGDPSGLVKLRRFLDDNSWLVRAMAGRYLGDFGTADDYTIIVARIGRELSNDFVVAEYCIAAIKLFAKKPA